MNHFVDQPIPDYFAAQFPGGGQRGYATVKLLEWFEKKIGLPTHQFFPYVTTGSVGILVAAALYLRHPDHPNAARMSARQLAELFPHIAVRMPQPAKFTNKNSREPFADAIRPYIGDCRLKDFLGTVFFSSHEIGKMENSYVLHGKTVCPTTGHEEYYGDPEKKILDIAFAGTALPSLFPAFEGQIDLAFAENNSEPLWIISQLFPGQKGAFVRVGNFRSKTEKARSHLYASGYVPQAANFSVNGAVSDHSYSQTVSLAKRMFQDMAFNLEYEIGPDYKDPPLIKANIATKAQFEKIDRMVEKFILENLSTFTQLANALKTCALKRMADHPETAFGIAPEVQEFPIEPIPPLPSAKEGATHSFSLASTKITKGLGDSLKGALLKVFDLATSDPVKAATHDLMVKFDNGRASWGRKLMPNLYHIPKGAQNALPPSSTESHEFF